jgi:hypothetical protein
VSSDLIQQLLDEIATLTEQNSELATNYVGLLDSLAAERALADQLAEWLLRIVPDQDRDLNDALTEWEARRER